MITETARARRRIATVWLLGATIILAGSACGHRRGVPAAGAGPAGKVPGGNLETITYEKTGGVAGFRLRLVVAPDGGWVARDLARDREIRGSFPPATMDSLRREIEGVPDDAWGSFPATVVDDFHYRLSIEAGGAVRRLEAGGSALPDAWSNVIRILDRPWPELFSQGR
jgi:hypothetical protein